MAESFAGNVHFDEAEVWQADAGPALSLRHTATHEVGHAIGLTHSTGTGDVMLASVSVGAAFAGLTQNDIDNIQGGYAAGVGTVVSLEQTGVWVDGNYFGPELGTFAAPVNTVQEGVNGVPPLSAGIPVMISAATYPVTLTVDRAMILSAVNGTVTIGF